MQHNVLFSIVTRFIIISELQAQIRDNTKMFLKKMRCEDVDQFSPGKDSVGAVVKIVMNLDFP
jgi:hypothetical protein